MTLINTHRLERQSQPSLRFATLYPQGTARGAVLITPGYLEHVGRYEHVMRLWADHGFAVTAHDPRGQGESEGRRGHILHFTEFTSDVYAVLSELDRDPAWRTLGAPILTGHSMGALISTRVAMEARRAFRGLGLLSPFFGVAVKAPAWKVWLGRNVSSFWPTFTEETGLNSAILTHDKQRQAMIESDPLGKPRVVTARWFTEMEASHVLVRSEMRNLELPIFCLAAGDDQIADLRATKAVFATLPPARAELQVLEGQFHELHQELNWREYMTTLANKFAVWC